VVRLFRFRVFTFFFFVAMFFEGERLLKIDCLIGYADFSWMSLSLRSPGIHLFHFIVDDVWDND